MTRSSRRGVGWACALPVFFGIIVVQALLLGGREYRLDEIWRLHAAIGRTPSQTLAYILADVNPPLYPVLASLWLPLTGHTEPATHHMSALILLLTLAFTFRFVADVFDVRTAAWACGLLGTLPVFFFYTHDAGPYTLYALATAATTFAFARWLYTRRLVYAVLYVVAGLAGVYTQLFTVFVIAAQVGFLLVFVRWDLRRAAVGLGLAAAVGLGLAVGLGPVLLARVTGDTSAQLLFAYFTTWSLDSVRVVVNGMDVMQILVISVLGAFTRLPTPGEDRLLRLGAGRLPLALFLTTLATFAVLFALNTAVTQVLTPRNMLLFLPVFAITAAVAVRVYGRVMAGAVLALAALNLFWYPLFTFGDYFAARDTAAAVDAHALPGAAVVVVTDTLTEFGFIPVNYYLRERTATPPAQIVWVAPPPVDNNAVRNVPFPHPPDTRLFPDDTPENRAALLDAVSGSQQVWTVEIQGNALGDALPDVLAAGYYRANTWAVPAGRTLVPAGEVRLVEYRPLPDDLAPRFRFGDNVAVNGWAFSTLTAAPCETVTARTFWTATTTPAANYSLNLSAVDTSGGVLAAADGGLTHTLSGLWLPGNVYPDVRELAVPCDAAPGEYALVITVYDPATVEPLPAITADGTAIERVVYITTLTVTR